MYDWVPYLLPMAGLKTRYSTLSLATANIVQLKSTIFDYVMLFLLMILLSSFGSVLPLKVQTISLYVQFLSAS